jgi:peptidoglycan hydrolase-like protein with peptidoglycan-binding domain
LLSVEKAWSNQNMTTVKTTALATALLLGLSPMAMAQVNASPGGGNTLSASPETSGTSAQSQMPQVGGNAVKQAQEALKSEGFYKGAVDGILGPETKTAISHFQNAKGLPQTSTLDQQTLSALQSSGNMPGGMSGSSEKPGSSGISGSGASESTGPQGGAPAAPPER